MNGRIAVLSSGRQDWGILRSTCARLRDDPSFEMRLLVGGMHCSPAFGRTVDHVRAEGFTPSEELAWIPEGRDVPALEQAAGALRAVGEALERARAGAVVLVGDRFETAAAAVAATLARTPIVHFHGGEESEGAFDNNFRHAITKMSHLHLVSHPAYRERVIAMGEDPATVHVVGAPGLDNARRADLPSRDALAASLGLRLAAPLVLVTVHPTTLATSGAASEVDAVIAAMDAVDATYVVTLPNTDPGHDRIRERLVKAAAKRPGRRVAVEALGETRYWGVLRLCDAVLGNSSSGIIEAPVLGVPTVNVGDRQRGRLRAASVLDVPADGAAVASALREVLEPAHRASLAGMASPYGDGRSAEHIHAILAAWTPPDPPIKRGVTAPLVAALAGGGR